jgi:NADPH-dependent ferric siderophore reductase
MAERRVLTTTVEVVEPLTPRMIRIQVTGDDLADFGAGPFTDHYVKCRFPVEGEERPKVRSYTVRAFDQKARRLTLDFVVHGDSGVAGPWAARAQPGDTLEMMGPGGAYTPDPEAEWHLLAGDAAVVPAIAVALQRIPAGVPVFAVIEVDDPEEEQLLESPGDLRLTWLHRSRAPGEEPGLLTEAVRALALPEGRGHAFVHGEASSARELRRHLLAERGLPKDALHCSGYWKADQTDEGWRALKPEWNLLVEADVT